MRKFVVESGGVILAGKTYRKGDVIEMAAEVAALPHYAKHLAPAEAAPVDSKAKQKGKK